MLPRSPGSAVPPMCPTARRSVRESLPARTIADTLEPRDLEKSQRAAGSGAWAQDHRGLRARARRRVCARRRRRCAREYRVELARFVGLVQRGFRG